MGGGDASSADEIFCYKHDVHEVDLPNDPYAHCTTGAVSSALMSGGDASSHDDVLLVDAGPEHFLVVFSGYTMLANTGVFASRSLFGGGNGSCDDEELVAACGQDDTSDFDLVGYPGWGNRDMNYASLDEDSPPTSADESFTTCSNPVGGQFDMFDHAFIDSAGGAGPHNLVGSSSSEFEDTDLIDNISDLLKSCFRKNTRKRGAGLHDHKRRRTGRNSRSPDCTKATNRGNLPWLSDIIKKIPGDKKSVICNYGFSCFLDIDFSGVPHSFAQWIADHVDVNTTDIVLDGGCINLSVESFCQVTGLNNSGDPVNVECVGGKRSIC